MTLSPLGQLESEGFFVAKNLVPLEAVDGVRLDVVRLAKELVGTAKVPSNFSDFSLSEVWNFVVEAESRDVAGLLYNAAKRLPSVHNLPLAANLSGFAERQLGVTHAAYLDLNFRIDAPLEDEFAFGWHQDFWFSESSPFALVAWVPLISTDNQIGGVDVIPGGDADHRLYKIRRGESYVSYSNAVVLDEEVDTSGSVFPQVEAGDCLFFRFHVLHRSRKNTSRNRQRWTIQSRIADFADPAFRKKSYKPGVVSKDYISILDDPS